MMDTEEFIEILEKQAEKDTVEVPIKWLEKLIELNDIIDGQFVISTDVKTINLYMNIASLVGYIESAKELLEIEENK
jgi:hypothetical protein